MQGAAAEGLKLRGHHLLCVFGFDGLGYDRRFVRNMHAITRAFFSQADRSVLVVEGCDDICAACPRMDSGGCARPGEGIVAERDRAVLARLDLKVGSRYRAAALVRAVVSRVRPEALDAICEGCEWLAGGYCRDGIERRAP